jgi:parallel beta-helix repeat protein
MRGLKWGLFSAFICWAQGASAETLVVESGQKIQDAVLKAKAGDTIQVMPGIYKEAVYVDKPDITLQGVLDQGEWPRLEGENKLNDGVVSSAAGFRIENMYIANFKGNGIMTQGADNVVIRSNVVDNTGIYGIYPTLGRNVVVEHNVAFGIADAAIYVGSCDHVDVNHNEVYKNVAGIEIENSENALVQDNLVYDNTGGILAFALPGLPRKKTENIVIRRNFVRDNNHRNFGAPGSVVANIPPGSGIIVLAADKVTIEGNVIRDNTLAGVVVADLSVMPGMSKDPEVDPNPDDIKVLANVMEHNGKQNFKSLVNWYTYVGRSLLSGSIPEGATRDLLPPGADVYASGKGERNCLVSQTFYATLGTEKFGVCDAAATGSIPTTMLVAKQAPRVIEAKDLGSQTYAAVCSGCHAMDMVRIGPAIREIRQKYAGNPDGIVAFATKPHKVRPGFPEMPPQAYLGSEKLNAVARYLLNTAEAH